MPTNVLVLRTAGTNCDRETAHAFELAGAEAHFEHVNRLIDRDDLLDDYQVLAIPGGFTYGDDISAGKILANQMVHHLGDALRAFVDKGRLVIGICNGFQVLVKTGLLPGFSEVGTQTVTLSANDSNRFEARWCPLKSSGSRCVFFPEPGQIMLPVAHGEGKFVADSKKTLDQIAEGRQIVFTYCSPAGSSPEYPDNPNGSQLDIAGICDPSGHVLGLMPHPERFVRREQHPSWTRLDLPEEGDGLQVFKNAVAYFK